MALLWNGDTLTGGGDTDFILAQTGTVLSGGSGNDVLLGDAAPLLTDHGATYNSSFANPIDLDANPAYWNLFENPLFGDNRIPHMSAYLAPAREEVIWYSINIPAGETITIDVDSWMPALGYDGGYHFIYMNLRNSEGNVVASAGHPDGTVGGLGTSINVDPYLSFTSQNTDTYYIEFDADSYGYYGFWWRDVVGFSGNEQFLVNISLTGHAVSTAAPPVNNDSILGGIGNDLMIGLGGDDRLQGDSGNDLILGGTGNDSAYGGSGNDTVNGGLGNDSLTGSTGNDSIMGADGLDTIYAGSGDDFTSGGLGDDRVFGEDGNDSVAGNAGSDVLSGGLGTDTLRGGVGLDTLNGDDGDDTLYGDNGGDNLAGGVGNDVLYGGDHADTILGGDGDDRIYGGLVHDVMTGGLGADIFYWDVKDFGSGLRSAVDQITDFNRTEGDRIDLSALDASTTVTGNNAFTFIGNGAFTGVTGQLHYVIAGGNTYIEGDRNGDSVADWAIRVNGVQAMQATDFVL